MERLANVQLDLTYTCLNELSVETKHKLCELSENLVRNDDAYPLDEDDYMRMLRYIYYITVGKEPPDCLNSNQKGIPLFVHGEMFHFPFECRHLLLPVIPANYPNLVAAIQDTILGYLFEQTCDRLEQL